MTKTLRFRLTAGYLAFFACLFAGFGFFLYHSLAAALERRLDDTLKSQAAPAAGLFQDEFVELGGNVAQAASEAVSEIRQTGSTIAVFERDRLIASSAPVVSGAFSKSRVATHRATAAGRTYTVLAAAPLDSLNNDLAVV